MPFQRKSSGKSGNIDLDKYCNSLLEANFYKLQQSDISQREVFKSVAAFVYKTNKCSKKALAVLAVIYKSCQIYFKCQNVNFTSKTANKIY